MQGMAGIDDVDVKVNLIQSLIPTELERVNELLQEEVEPRLRKVNGWRHLPLLRYKIKEELQLRKKEKYPLEKQVLFHVGV